MNNIFLNKQEAMLCGHILKKAGLECQEQGGMMSFDNDGLILLKKSMLESVQAEPTNPLFSNMLTKLSVMQIENEPLPEEKVGELYYYTKHVVNSPFVPTVTNGDFDYSEPVEPTTKSTKKKSDA